MYVIKITIFFANRQESILPRLFNDHFDEHHLFDSWDVPSISGFHTHKTLSSICFDVEFSFRSVFIIISRIAYRKYTLNDFRFLYFHANWLGVCVWCGINSFICMRLLSISITFSANGNAVAILHFIQRQCLMAFTFFNYTSNGWLWSLWSVTRQFNFTFLSRKRPEHHLFKLIVKLMDEKTESIKTVPKLAFVTKWPHISIVSLLWELLWF